MPFSISNYDETDLRVKAAMSSAKKVPSSRWGKALKRALLRMQYNGVRRYFEKHRNKYAVVWNGLNGNRLIFINAAKDAGAHLVYFEEAPFQGRITVDTVGINFENSLHSTSAPYLEWAAETGNADAWRSVTPTIIARANSHSPNDAGSSLPLTDNFIFVPLQAPKDSQLKVFGGAFGSIEFLVRCLSDAAKVLPDGWHVRIKEHPSSARVINDFVAQQDNPRLILDNSTDTFEQVKAARTVITVNSSVGLQAMYFGKPVVALGQSFWAIPGAATQIHTPEGLKKAFEQPGEIDYDPHTRACFLSFLTEYYYPCLDRNGPDGGLHPAEVEKLRSRLTRIELPILLNAMGVGQQAKP